MADPKPKRKMSKNAADLEKAEKIKKLLNPAGRPRLFSSPDEFDMKLNKYMEMCQTTGTPVTYTGLCLALGFTAKTQFTDYGKEHPEFKDVVSKARMLIENAYEIRLVVGVSPPAGSIFALKNMGWVDKHPTELDHLMAEKLKRELAAGVDDPANRPTSVSVSVVDASVEDKGKGNGES